jgi:4-hydroxyphenylpyruvate dioxygenase
MSDLLVNLPDGAMGDREPLGDRSNPLGLDGIEFIEYATSKPQALGQVLEMMGFKPVARHRSREVLLYRQGDMNIVVNANPIDVKGTAHGDKAPVISAIALRVGDARDARRRVLERGAWEVPPRAEVMELNIPAIHGAGGSRIYFVDRYRDFSIYDVDFSYIPSVERNPPAQAGMHFFGVVQYIGPNRSDDWIEFYRELFGFELIPDEMRFGILPRGKLMRSPCGSFMLQLVEPEPLVLDSSEKLQRIGIGVPDVMAAVAALRRQGVEFNETPATHTETRGALTRPWLGSVMFELVHSELGREP